MTGVETATAARLDPSAEGCADVPRRSFVEHIMGIPMSVHVRGPRASGSAVAAAVEAAYAALRADDDMFSTWKPHSPVSRIRAGHDRLSDAPKRIRHVAELCRRAEYLTEGSFTAWLPTPDGRLAFDPTGLVKGWSVAEATAGLIAAVEPLGAHDVLVYAGGDIAVCCGRTDTPDWVIAVEDPRSPGRVLRAVKMRTGAVATSGTAARGTHIHDPHSGRPASSLLSATVIGPDLTWADVYATAAFVKGPGAAPWIATLGQHAGILVDRDGRVIHATSVVSRTGGPSVTSLSR